MSKSTSKVEQVKARYKNLGWKSIEHACYAEVARQFDGASLEEETKGKIAKAMRFLIIEKNSEFYGPSQALRDCMPKLGQIIN